MVNSRQVVVQIDDNLKFLISEAIATSLTSTMADVTKTIEDQVNKSIDAMNSSFNEVCVRHDFLNVEIQRLSGVILLIGCIDFSRNNRENVTWEVYVKALLKRFCSIYEDLMLGFKNIRYVHGHKCSGKLFSLEIVEECRELGNEIDVQCSEGCLVVWIVKWKLRQGRKVAIKGAPQLALRWMEGKPLSGKLYSMAVCVYPSSGIQAELMSTEEMVKELLDSGVIRVSCILFSSPIVMVNKKDGTWRMCVDYRALYKQTVKDKFPIPIIEELIDELFGAQVFTNLDLSYQQAFDSLLKKNSYEWSDSAQMASDELKAAMINAYVLALPNFQKEFIVETDASNEGIGVVLQQKGHPIAFLSRSLAPRHKGLSTYEKELWDLVYDLEKWMEYFLDKHLKVKTNHFSLKYLMEQRLTTPFQIKWLPKLLGYDYKIVYKKGSENIMANALSRSPIPSLQTMLIAEISNDLLQRIKGSWVADPMVSKCGVVGYKLMLLENATVYNVFHVSQLKPFKGQPYKPIPLPHCTTTGLITLVPVAVFERKIAKVRNAAVVYLLVQWSNGDVDDATWEVATEIQTKYRKFNANS
ncbi:retrovirus-related pol polyprotein from transposon 17.6 [Tanacetum coccineum]